MNSQKYVPDIVVLEGDCIGADIDLNLLKELGHVTIYGQTVEEQDVISRIREADIIISNKCHLYEGTLKDAANVKLICNMATGYDNIDTKYCALRNIPVTNAVNYSSASVAQLTFALALSLLCKIPYYNGYVKDGSYTSSGSFTHLGEPVMEINDKVWGIVGYGNIGRTVAKIADAFGAHVILYSPSGRSYDEEYEQVSFAELLEKSDILSLHCPLTEKTNHLFDADAFAKMKENAIIINVARGKVVDNNALFEALDKGMIAGAGMDCFEEEPILKTNPLLNIKDDSKLIMTPHTGWASQDARNQLLMEVYKNIQAFLEGRERNIVNNVTL